MEFTQKNMIIAGVAAVAIIAFFVFGGSTSQEAEFNGDNNTQSADKNVNIEVNQTQENNQKQ